MIKQSARTFATAALVLGFALTGVAGAASADAQQKPSESVCKNRQVKEGQNGHWYECQGGKWVKLPHWNGRD